MSSIIMLLVQIVRIYEFFIFIRCILSFIQPSPYGPLAPILRFIYQITDPLLNGVRNAFPVVAQGGIDFSPIVVILLIEFTISQIIRLAG